MRRVLNRAGGYQHRRVSQVTQMGDTLHLYEQFQETPLLMPTLAEDNLVPSGFNSVTVAEENLNGGIQWIASCCIPKSRDGLIPLSLLR